MTASYRESPSACSGVPADEHGARLRHEPAHVADVAADEDRSALQRDAGPGGGVTLDDDGAAVAGSARALRGVALDPDDPVHQVLADGPADEAVDHDVGTAPERADEVAGVPRDVDRHPVGQAHPEVVPAAAARSPGPPHRRAARPGRRLISRVLSSAQLRITGSIRRSPRARARRPRPRRCRAAAASAWYSEAMAT